MPDTATAPTATNAQTRAAGTRMLGFYLGGGGAKVDALIDPANFVMKDAAGDVGIGAATVSPIFGRTLQVSDGSQNGTVAVVGTSGAGYIGTFGPGFIVHGRGGMSLLLGANDDTKATITPAGNFGVGVTPGVRMHVKSAGEIGRLETTTARGAGNGYLGFQDPTGQKGFVGYGGASDVFYVVNSISAELQMLAGSYGIVCQPDGDFRPSTSGGGQNLGKASHKWATVYAVTGAINTSDERFKFWVEIREDRRTKDRRIARRILDELGWFQFIESIDEKGPDGARWHFGARAQRVWAIVADEGLAPPLVDLGGKLLPDFTWSGPVAPAWLTFDSWNEAWEDEVAETTIVEDVIIGNEGTGVLGPDGVEVLRPVFEQEERIERRPTGLRIKTRDAGYVFGFRTDQLNMMLTWALHDRLSVLEAAG